MTKKEPEKIFNYLKISGRISTSGQPLKQETPLIIEEGAEVVISLVPEGVKTEMKSGRCLLNRSSSIIRSCIRMKKEKSGGNNIDT